MKRNKRNGISLIVLVITIIVMIILAASIILSLNSNGILGKASEAKKVSDLAHIKELAQFAWSDAYLDGKTTQSELEVAVNNSIKNSGISQDVLDKYTIVVTTSGVTVTLKKDEFEMELVHDGPKILEGATYYVGVTSNELGNYEGATAIYKAGDNFPETVSEGDVYVYANCEYRYNLTYLEGEEDGEYEWQSLYNSLGWGMRVLDDTKTTYSGIVQSINGVPITTLEHAFSGCESLTTLPADFQIPSAAENMRMMFYNCTSLTILPDNFTIPAEAYLGSTFENCSSLVNLPEKFVIPEGVTEMSYTFFGCSSLKSIPNVPSTVTNMNGTFAYCSAITSLPDGFVLPSGVTSMNGTFENCESLTSLPDNFTIPSEVTDVIWLFAECSSLKSLPQNFTIPESVTEMNHMLYNCELLTTLPEGFVLPSGVTDIDGLFDGCKALEKLPTNFVIPNGITFMNSTFFNCLSLEDTITINANPDEYADCFYLEEEGKNITLTGASTILSDIAGTSSEGLRTITVE